MPHTPYGYRIENGKAVLDEIKAEQVRVLFGEYVSGASLVSTGRKSGVGSNHSSLGRTIDNRVYVGDEFYPQIVRKELWNKAQDERQFRAMALGRDKNYFAKDKSDTSPFRGKIICSVCRTEYRRYLDNRKERWQCGKRTVNKKLYCNSLMIYESAFEEAFMRMVR